MRKKNVICFALYLLFTQITSVYAYEPENLPPPEYSAEAVVLMDAATGLVLYETQGHERMYPASVTKIMTALVVLEHTADLTERIEFCDYAVWGIPRNSSHIYMDVGETLSIYESLYALMLESANEVSVALALHIAGSVEDFADLMNLRAVQIGATGTNFTNPSGLPGRDHFTTAHDMALIMREAVRNPIFVNIISSARFDIPPTERQSETRHLLNFNQMIRAGAFYNENVRGGKTGWTTAAGNTLVTYAYQDGRRLITSVLRGEGPATFTDTSELLRYGFALPMEYVTVFDAAAYSVTVPVKQEIGGNLIEIARVPLAASSNLEFELPHNWQMNWLRYELSAPEMLPPPVMADSAVGRVAVYVQNIRVGDAILTATDTVFEYVPATPAEVYEPYTPTETIPEIHYVIEYQPMPQIFTGRLAFLNNEYVLTLIIPLSLSLITLAISIFMVATRHKRRLRKMLRKRRARFDRYPHYRYKAE